MTKPLLGWRILVVEDEALIALDLAETFVEAGASVVGPAHTVRHALHLIERFELDAAVTDFRLEKETSIPVATLLRSKGVPFLIHTSALRDVEDDIPNAPIIYKPSLPEQLVAAVASLRTKCSPV